MILTDWRYIYTVICGALLGIVMQRWMTGSCIGFGMWR